MKKISTLLFATIISWAAMAQLNPYAYGLSSNWNPTTQILTVDFKLNAKANKITIYAVDGSTEYKIHEITSPSNTLDYSIPIHINGKDKDGKCLPVGKNLTFAVEVDGGERNEPGTPVYTGNRPYSPHGVAVNNCQDSQDFGAVYVTECTNGVSGDQTWGWLSDKGRSLLEYNPRLEYSNFYRKSSDFSSRNVTWKSDGTYNSGGDLLEPHRVVVSDDGRIFVSSYNQNGSNDKIAVWEFNRQTREYTPLIYHNTAYGDRVVAMDIKGTTATGLKMMLAFFEVNTDGKRGYYIQEYTISGNTGSATATWVKNPCNYVPSNGNGTQYEKIQDLLKESVDLHYFCYTDGFTDIAYGAKDPSTVFIGIDYFVNTSFRTSLVYYNGTYNYHNTTLEGQRYGGGGLVTYKGTNGEDLIAMGRCQLGNNTEDDGRIQVYALNSVNVPSDIRYTIPTKTKNVVNDIAIDCANNLYAVSYIDKASKWPTGTGTLLAVPMPYSGTVTTIAPSSNAPFSLPAVVELNQSLSIANLRQLNENHPADCGCDIDVNLVRPLRGGMYNTICLPFDLNVNNLATNHPYYNAEVLEFNGVTTSTINNESVLELNFVSTNGVINHSKPYLIKPQNDIPDGVPFDNITLQPVYTFLDSRYQVTKDDVTYWGVMGAGTFSFDPSEDVVLILVDDNRLAQLSSGGYIDGFRGFFYFLKSLISEGTVVRLAERKNTPTTLIDAQEKEIDIQKFINDGRVYIRMGDTLYNINGEKVE